MDYHEGSSTLPMTPEEILYIGKLLKNSRTGIKITSVISFLLSGVVTAGILIPSYHMIAIPAVPLFFLILLTIVLAVKISQYKQDISEGMKTIYNGPADKKYIMSGKGITRHYFKMGRKRYIVNEEFYKIMEAHDMMDVHHARHSRIVLGIYNLSRKNKIVIGTD